MGFSLHTERLTLRDYTESDYGLVYELFMNPALAQFHLRDQHSEDYVIETFERGRCQTQVPTRFVFDLVVVSITGELVGLCGLRCDWHDPNRAQLNWDIRPQYWNRGYATEAAGCLLAYGFEKLDFVQIEANAFADNLSSIRVMEKIGLRPAHNTNTAAWWRGLTYGESRATLRYNLSREEWLAMKLPAAVRKAAA